MQSVSTAGRYGDARTWSKSYRRASSSMVLIAFPGPDLTDPLSLPFVDLLTPDVPLAACSELSDQSATTARAM